MGTRCITGVYGCKHLTPRRSQTFEEVGHDPLDVYLESISLAALEWPGRGTHGSEESGAKPYHFRADG